MIGYRCGYSGGLRNVLIYRLIIYGGLQIYMRIPSYVFLFRTQGVQSVGEGGLLQLSFLIMPWEHYCGIINVIRKYYASQKEHFVFSGT